MTFAPFFEYFPILASEETLQINITSQAPDDPPSGVYYFHELFCFDPECDCQNAIIAVNRKNKEGKFEEVARLRFCWKNNAFYEEIGLLFGGDILPAIFPDMNRRPARFDDYFAKLFESKCYERSHNCFKPQETPYTKKVKHHYKLYKEHLIRKSPNKQPQEKQSQPQSKLERNDPCFCGSGKKYKKCCLVKDNNLVSTLLPLDVDAEWIRIRTCEADIMEILKSYVEDKFGPQMRLAAMGEFALDCEVSVDMSQYQAFFDYWFYFTWKIDSDLFDYSNDSNQELTIADAHLKEHPGQFTSYQKRFIRAACDTPFTFYIIEDVISEHRLILKDIFTHNQLAAKERKGTQNAKKGDIAFGRHVTLDNQSIMVGFAPFPISNRYYSELMGARDSLCESMSSHNCSLELLRERDFELRKLYFDVLKKAMTPPKFVNTDFELILLHDLVFEMKCSPREAFDKLFGLCQGEDPENWLSSDQVICDKYGKLMNVKFFWLEQPTSESVFIANKALHVGYNVEIVSNQSIYPKATALENAALAYLTITQSEITVFVNSENRAKKIKEEILNRLGSQVVYKTCKITDPHDEFFGKSNEM